MDWKFEIIDGRGVLRNPQRETEIIGMFTRGMTLQEVGDIYGVTRQRIEQILKRNGINGDFGGRTLKTFLKSRDKIEQRKLRSEKRKLMWESLLECSWEEICAILGGEPRWRKGGETESGNPLFAFLRQKRSAKTRGIDWALTFSEWWKIWQESGKWDKRGRGRGYCMARYGDSGGYTNENVYICTVGQNFSDSYLTKSMDHRIYLRGPGKKGYQRTKKFFYVYPIKGKGPYIGRYRTAREAHECYLKAWHEAYDPK